MSPLVLLSDGCAFSSPRCYGGKLKGSKSRSRFIISKILKRKYAATTKSKCKYFKSNAISLLNACLSMKNKIKFMGTEEKFAAQPPHEVRNNQQMTQRDREMLRWTYGVCIDGKFSLVSMGMMLSSGCYLPIVDRNGLLLGNFRELDDMSI
ncbi:OLC1v1011563C1 [Oldenlandia corymbosa var. corymbosa]|uniref:OLC1v1011563C1 n=1 Tax=Oldenlandia corymbosa var. corymbosa TaxID=529605 RepID=A0AAV1DU50_OLDCO|nr:OLC1v1011563C1 [Oldenlandia corymbosa var. corymbosa]